MAIPAYIVAYSGGEYPYPHATLCAIIHFKEWISKIEVESEVGRGLTVVVSIPLQPLIHQSSVPDRNIL
jgi:hypothetical protein